MKSRSGSRIAAKASRLVSVLSIYASFSGSTGVVKGLGLGWPLCKPLRDCMGRNCASPRAKAAAVAWHWCSRQPRREARMAELRVKILLVEDDREISRFIYSSLGAAGFLPLGADSLAQARRLFAESPPSLVILDLGLPDGDGKEWIRELRQFSDTPVLV